MSIETDENGRPLNKTKKSLNPVTEERPTAARPTTAADGFGAFPEQSAVPSDRWDK